MSSASSLTTFACFSLGSTARSRCAALVRLHRARERAAIRDDTVTLERRQPPLGVASRFEGTRTAMQAKSRR
jgi:hypothetical protein